MSTVEFLWLWVTNFLFKRKMTLSFTIPRSNVICTLHPKTDAVIVSQIGVRKWVPYSRRPKLSWIWLRDLPPKNSSSLWATRVVMNGIDYWVEKTDSRICKYIHTSVCFYRVYPYILRTYVYVERNCQSNLHMYQDGFDAGPCLSTTEGWLLW